jgi:hypothetical protein
MLYEKHRAYASMPGVLSFCLNEKRLVQNGFASKKGRFCVQGKAKKRRNARAFQVFSTPPYAKRSFLRLANS